MYETHILESGKAVILFVRVTDSLGIVNHHSVPTEPFDPSENQNIVGHKSCRNTLQP